jgi:hypothetical protein
MGKFYLSIYIEEFPELLGKEVMRAGLILNQDRSGGIKEGGGTRYYDFRHKIYDLVIGMYFGIV